MRHCFRQMLPVMIVACFLALVCSHAGMFVAAADEPAPKLAAPIDKGERVYSIGHSFHVFMPRILADIVKTAEIEGHQQVGLSSIGGSRVIQHWDIADDKFKSKAILAAGGADVLTMSPIYLPDDGIDKFVKLAVEHQPDIRIFVQENWLPFDLYDPTFKIRPKMVDHDALTIDELRERHESYFATIDARVKEMNEELGQRTVHVAPVGQAVLALRTKIAAGEAPGLEKQGDLFTDAIGHARPTLAVLVGYVYYSVIYRRSPVGLPTPAFLGGSEQPQIKPELLQLLQEIAWQAAQEHPLSGVTQP